MYFNILNCLGVDHKCISTATGHSNTVKRVVKIKQKQRAKSEEQIMWRVILPGTNVSRVMKCDTALD